jgi:hypothetical protein
VEHISLPWFCGLWYVEVGNSRPGVYYITDCTAGVKGLVSEANLGVDLAYCFESLIYGPCFGWQKILKGLCSFVCWAQTVIATQPRFPSSVKTKNSQGIRPGGESVWKRIDGHREKQYFVGVSCFYSVRWK